MDTSSEDTTKQQLNHLLSALGKMEKYLYIDLEDPDYNKSDFGKEVDNVLEIYRTLTHSELAVTS